MWTRFQPSGVILPLAFARSRCAYPLRMEQCTFETSNSSWLSSESTPASEVRIDPTRPTTLDGDSPVNAHTGETCGVQNSNALDTLRAGSPDTRPREPRLAREL
eukprot:5603498-Amphidinium_carterae.1